MRRAGKCSKYFQEEFPHQVEIPSAFINSILKRKVGPFRWKTIARVLIGQEYMEENCTKYLEDRADLSNACSLLEVVKIASAGDSYEKFLKICTEAGFAVLESNDFYQVDPATLVTFASQPNLNVGSETEIFYALWMRSTVDCCRDGLDTSRYKNISRYFEAYSACIRFEHVDEKKLHTYNNCGILNYYKWRMGQSLDQNAPSKFPKRGYRYPINLPPKFFMGFIADEVRSFVQLMKKAYEIKFSVDETVYMIGLKFACTFKERKTEKCLKYIRIKSQNQLVYEEQNTLNLNLGNQEYVGKTLLYPIEYHLKSSLKLYPGRKYSMIIESYPEPLWPVIQKFHKIYPVNFKFDRIVCLIEMKLLKCP